MAARNRAFRPARIGPGAATQFGRPPAAAKRRRAGADQHRFHSAFAESRLGRAGLDRLCTRHTRRAGAACAAAATLALAGAALSNLERGSVAQAAALALSAALLAALTLALRPTRPKGHVDRKRRGGAKRHTGLPPSAGRRGNAQQSAASKDDRPDSPRRVEKGKPASPNGSSRKAGRGCGRTLLRDHRGRFVSPRSPLARIVNRRAFGRACRHLRDAVFAKQLDQGAAAQDERSPSGAEPRSGGARSAKAEFDRLCADDQTHARTACAAAAALALTGAAAPFLAHASSTSLVGLIFGPATVAMLAVALHSDRAAWQIRQRRFAGLAEYVRMRWLGRGARLTPR